MGEIAKYPMNKKISCIACFVPNVAREFFSMFLKRGIIFFTALLLPFTLFASPDPKGFVNDFAGILTAEDSASLESKLSAYEAETSNEVVLVIVNSFEGADRFSYSQELFTKWGIGKEEKNNGILFLLGPKEGLPFPERGEAFINVGRGLEGALPDSLTGAILRDEIFPKFKEKKYFEGLNNGIDAIIQATKGEYTAAAKKNGALNSDSLWLLIWFAFIFLTYLASFLGRSKSWWAGGVIGGVVGVIIGFIFWTGFLIVGAGAVLAVLGFIFDYIVSKNYQYRKSHGKPTDFWHSGGGFWFGGRGGFGGGGGFGGFGGGSSGGGGAGGSW